MSLYLVSLRDLPHTYFCTCFYSTKQTKVGNKDTTGLITGEFKLYSLKAHGVSVAPQFLFVIIFFIYFYINIFFIMANWA
jgi:hypothetical protein